MDRSLKWRTLILIGITLFCIATLAPSFVPKESLPTWFRAVFSKQINLGLDLQGGKHIVYNIDLDKAVDDYASEIKRDLEAFITDNKIDAPVKTPRTLLGAVTVQVKDPSKRSLIEAQIDKDFHKNVTARDCTPEDGPGAICLRVSPKYADDIKTAALNNAVSTIRDRINERGLAEATVVEKGDDIIVELPGDPKSDVVVQTEELIKHTAKLEMKVVDDCRVPGPQGCTASVSDHSGSQYMRDLFNQVEHEKDPDAIRLEIKADTDLWRPEEGGGDHTDYYLRASDRDELVPIAWAKKKNKLIDKNKIVGDKVMMRISGREIIERYVFGDPDFPFEGLANKDPKFKMRDDHELGFEPVEAQKAATEGKPDNKSFWRTYYLEHAVRLTGSAIADAYGNFDPNTGRPVVLLDFNRFGSRVFGDVTAQIVGMKFATILDDRVRSAPIINAAIRGGRANITMGGSDPKVQEAARNELVTVLKTGSLPAPLREASHSDVGPTLGRDSIEKTKMSFAIGIALVVLIMVGVYRWSGFIAVFAVVFHIIMTLAVMALFGATLTLPGIAAIVLSIGMEVDGNILIYERIRDELLLGKSVRGAIDLGFSRAFSAILDGQLTTAAAGWVLLQYGSGPIKGFAVMLLVGVFTTLTTNIWVTRILFDWNVSRKKGQLVTLSI
ncbi:MAG: protein-export rane protein SecD [Myxococcales bacterium]|nr:protein-export rane protein SecD [Myxococcales bacterium]